MAANVGRFRTADENDALTGGEVRAVLCRRTLRRRRSALLALAQLGLALLLVAQAMVLSAVLHKALPPYGLVFVVVVVLSGWLAGFWPALLVAVAARLGAEVIFFPFSRAGRTHWLTHILPSSSCSLQSVR